MLQKLRPIGCNKGSILFVFDMADGSIGAIFAGFLGGGVFSWSEWVVRVVDIV